MAKRITRNVKDVKDVKTFGINHTTQNDLINDDKNVFVHQKGKFEKITHQIDTLSSDGSVTISEKDDKDNVSLSVYTGYVDKITSSDESLIVGKKTNGTVNVKVNYAPIYEKIQVANSQLETQVMEAIGLEEKNRTGADTKLATDLATEVANRKSADNAIQTKIDNLSTKTFLYKIEGFTLDNVLTFIIYIELPKIYKYTPSLKNFMTYLSENDITSKLCDGISKGGARFSFITVKDDMIYLNLIKDYQSNLVFGVESILNITAI